MKEFKFINYEILKKTHRIPLEFKKNQVFLRKKLEENIHDSGIENCGTAFMLEDMGRGNFKFSRRWAWAFRQYIWASRVPSLSKRRARVIDIGCDVGEIRKMISRSFYTKNPDYLGIDIDHIRILKGAQKIQFKNEAVYIQHDITFGLPFIKSNAVDVVYFGETIEHFEKIYGIKILEEIFRILKRGGRLCISTPNKDKSKRYDFHVYEYTVLELKEILKKIGFILDKIYGWQTTEKLIFESGNTDAINAFLLLKEAMCKDLAVPVIAFLLPNNSDAFCIEAIKSGAK